MKSLFLRMFLWSCGATILIVFIIGAGFVADSPGALATNWRALGHAAIVAAARATAEQYESSGEPAAASYLRSLVSSAGLRGALLDASGRPLSTIGFTPDAGTAAMLRACRQGEVAVFARRRLAGVPVRTAAGATYLFITTLPPREIRYWGRALILSLTITGLCLCYLLARYMTSPILHLRALTSRLTGGDLAARMTVPAILERKDEVGGLARDFNRMAARIETLVKSQQRLMADVSHELRSPITRLRLAVGLMRQRGEAEAASSLARMEREIERLDALIAQLLTLSRLECLDQPPRMEVFDLSALVQEIVADVDFEATSDGRGVRLLECAACSMRGARDLVRSAIENVIRNAVTYTEVNTQVQVRLARVIGSRTAGITVEDHGPGVPEGELAHLFEPFYRVDDARDRHTGGAGLGLAITQQVVTLHGGAVSAANREAGGLEVRIALPVEDAGV